MLKVIVKSLDEVEEQFRGLYKQVGDNFILQIDGVDNHPSVTSLKSAMENAKKERKEAKEALDALKAKIGGDLPDDFSLAEYQRLKGLDDDDDDDDKKKRKEKDDERFAKVRQTYEQQIANLKSQHETKIAELSSKIESVNTLRGKDRAEVELEKAMDKANIDPKFRPAVRALHLNAIKSSTEDDSSMKIFIETNLGEMPVIDYISTWAESDEGKVYVSTATGGGGFGGKPTAMGGHNPFAAGSWNKTEQAALRNDPGKLNRLAQAAGFKDGQDGLGATAPKKSA